MSSSTWVNYAIGIVGGIAVGFLTAGIGLGAYAAFAGVAAFSITASYLNAKYAGPKMGGLRPPSGFGNAGGQTGMKDAAAASLQINSASESVMLPVVFGLCRISGNNTRYDLSTFRSVPIIERVQRDPQQVAYALAQKAYRRNPSAVNHSIDKAAEKQQQEQGGGGKGGAQGPPPPSQSYNSTEKIGAYTQVLLKNSNGGKKLPKEYDEYVVGYNYYLSWELAICMGPVNALHAVRIYPGEFAVVDRTAAPELLAAETGLSATGGGQGGTIRFYRGTPTQVRNVADPYATPHTNYRNVAFAVFQNYHMGQQAAPSSYAFEVERIPVCLGEDGLPIPGFKTRGSASPSDDAYRDANPAAILWEIFTNKLWGKGLDPILLDAPSFILASEYFEAQKIGMSFSLEAQSLITEAVETIRNHVNTTVVWYGSKLYCRCQLDRTNAYEPMVVITSDNVSDPQVSRPAWPSTSNEIRATFMNRKNNFASEIVIAQDIANMATVGRINSTTIDLPAFSTREVTERACKRLLLEMSYPQATLKFKMNRFETRLQPGGFMAFIWNEWSAGPLTSYWRVMEVTDNDQDAGGVEVICAEDLYATAVEGAVTSFDPPVPAFEGVTVNTDEDLYYGDVLGGPFEAGNIDLQIYELPINLTEGDRVLAFFSQRLNGQTRGINVFWRVSGSGADYTQLGSISPWAITGTLAGAITADPKLTRQASFEITLTNLSEKGNFLELASAAPTDSDPIDIVTGSETNLLRIGDEVMQVIQAEAGSLPNRVRVKALIRGQFGTDAAAHAGGAPVAFLYEFIPYVFTLRYDGLPLNTLLDIMATPFDRWGQVDTSLTQTYTITNRAQKAFPLERWTAAAVGLSWTGSFRPRFHNRGSENSPDHERNSYALTGEVPDGYEFYVMPQTAGNADVLLAPVALPVTFIPEDGNDPASGMITFAYTAPATTAKLLIYQAFNGVLGYPTQITS